MPTVAKRTIMSDLTGKTGTKGKGKSAADDDEGDEIDLTEDDADESDDDEDEDDDESDDDESDDDDEDDAELGPKGIKALRAERKKVRELTRQLAAATQPKPKKKAKSSKDDDEDEDDDRSESDAKIAKRELALKKSSAKSALLAAGVTPKNADLLVGRIDFDDVDIDDDGDVDGLDDQIDELKDEYEEFFKAKKDDDDERPRRRRVPGSGDGARRGSAEPKTKSSADRLAARLVGKG